MWWSKGRFKSLEMIVDNLKMEIEELKMEQSFLLDNQMYVSKKVDRSIDDTVCKECGCIMLALPSLQVRRHT